LFGGGALKKRQAHANVRFGSLATDAAGRAYWFTSASALHHSRVVVVSNVYLAGLGIESGPDHRCACDMWLFRNNPLKKITDQFATLRIWGSYVGFSFSLMGDEPCARLY
jgi:hypothetical protein